MTHTNDDRSSASTVPMQPASIDIWEKKYRLCQKDGTPVDGSIQASLQRVAEAIGAVEPDEQGRAYWTEQFAWALGQGAIPAGRILSNAGALAHKPATSTINCTVSGTIGDSMDDILSKVHEAGLTLKSGAGVGYEHSTLRPRGAYVSGAGAQTSGPVSFMDIFDRMCATVSSAGGRRGAQMSTFDVRHPDVEEFIKAKREDGRLRQFNLSLLITESFIEAVRNDAPWQLIFPIRQREQQSETLDLSDSTRFVWAAWPLQEDQVVNDEGLVACRVYRTLPARTLWDLIMSSTYDYAEPGFILIDKVNEMNNNWFDEVIRASNPCVTADTWVQTAQGPRRVDQLIGSPFQARVDGVDHHTGRAGFFRTGTKPVVRLSTVEGYSLRLTSEHRVRRVSAFQDGVALTSWCAVADLAPGDHVLMNDHRRNAGWAGELDQQQGYRLGRLAGAGAAGASRAASPVRAVAQATNSVRSTGHTPATSAGDGEHGVHAPARGDGRGRAVSRERRPSGPDMNALAMRFDVGRADAPISSLIEASSSQGHIGFLRGIFDALGHAEQSPDKGIGVRLSPMSQARAEAIQRMLQRLGIGAVTERGWRGGEGGCGACGMQYELVIRGASLVRFVSMVGFVDEGKRWALDDLMERCERQPARERFVARVQAIEADGMEDVYDVQVPGINTFDADGFHAHNCGEQMLPPYGACLLGSIDLTRFVSRPFTRHAAFEWERFEKTVTIFTRLLDNVVELNGLPLQRQRDEIVRKRRHGMGYLGLGSALTLMGMRYGDEDSIRFTDDVTRRMAIAGWRAGLSLAREKGACPIMDELFSVDARMLRLRPEMAQDGIRVGDRVPGRVLHAKYSRYMQLIAQVEPELVEDLAEHGCRFTHHSSIAPTGTIALSLGNNASNGIEPSFAHLYSRNVIREGRRTKEKVDVLSYELLAYRHLINEHASPAPEDPANALPEHFMSADEITPKDHVRVQAASQRWIDSSISKTINVPTDYPFEDFKDVYLFAYEQGLKGCTTFRFNPENFQGVLVKESDLAATEYRFTSEDGSVVSARGNEMIEYDGEIHTAANLYDALKERTYGSQ